MKDKLRELDERACVPVNRPNLYAAGWNDCRAVVLALIDAKGDGGAVTCQDALIYAGDQYTDKYKDDDRQDIKTDVLNAFYQGANWMRKTNPARSGVVSDEDVVEACEYYDANREEGSQAEFIGMLSAVPQPPIDLAAIREVIAAIKDSTVGGNVFFVDLMNKAERAIGDKP